MSWQSFSVVARSAADPAAVFALLADAPRWQEWAKPLVPRSSWEREGDGAPGGVGAIRRLGRPPVVTREEIVEYDPPRRLAYVILSGVPVREYRAEVDLTAEGDGTRIDWRARFEPRVPGTGPLVRAGLGRLVGGLARRLAVAAAGDVRT